MTKNLIKISLIILFVVVLKSSFAQTIPNAGFENWTTTGSYSDPDNWMTQNSTTSASNVYTAEKGTPGSPGTSYLKLTSKTVGMRVTNGTASSRFAYNQRSANFIGKWQHMISGTSQGSVDIQFTRWDAGMSKNMPVASGHVVLSGMAMSWAAFNIPMVYSDSLNMPDSCSITFAASGFQPADGDYLWVDDLSFSGTVAMASGINQIDDNIKSVELFPNPSFTTIKLKYNLTNPSTIIIKLFDVTGKQITTLYNGQAIIGKNELAIDCTTLNQGLYIVKIESADGYIIKQLEVLK
ncbi:MAG: hypothetical protein RIQ33_1532 [Bacteroidota bacterium]|jgi:hypothetical protein